LRSAPELRVNAHGFSLHAAVRWRADQRAELEHLCRYITRPVIANERLKRNRAGQVVLQLKSPYKTAPPISSWSRWSSWSAWLPWCRGRVSL
jgi:Putative transposase